MSFWADIAAALGREADELEVDLGHMVVEDNLNAARLRTVLLFESPDSDEINHEHPLAGYSGGEVTKAFSRYHPNFGELTEPIGRLLGRLHNGEIIEQLSEGALGSLNSLGLMNVSRLPLQSSAYCFDLRLRYSDLLCYFEAIRARLDGLDSGELASGVQYVGSLDARLPPSQVYRALRSDLVCRLPQSEDVEVIPCGRVASVFYCWAMSPLDAEDYAIPNDFVPHPSYGWWSREKYRDRIRELVERVHERATD